MSNRASIAALLQKLDQRSPAGFAIALHITFSTPRYMFQTYAPRWLDRYNSEGLLLRDPVVQWGMQNVGRVRWSDLEALDSEGVLEEVLRHRERVLGAVVVGALVGSGLTGRLLGAHVVEVQILGMLAVRLELDPAVGAEPARPVCGVRRHPHRLEGATCAAGVLEAREIAGAGGRSIRHPSPRRLRSPDSAGAEGRNAAFAGRVSPPAG